MTEENNKNLVAYCGLYCGSCGSYTKRRCKSCKSGGGFSSCKVRICCEEKNYETCAECKDFQTCKILNNFISKIFGFIFRTNRLSNLTEIKDKGILVFAEERSKTGKK